MSAIDLTDYRCRVKATGAEGRIFGRADPGEDDADRYEVCLDEPPAGHWDPIQILSADEVDVIAGSNPFHEAQREQASRFANGLMAIAVVIVAAPFALAVLAGTL